MFQRIIPDRSRAWLAQYRTDPERVARENIAPNIARIESSFLAERTQQ